MRAHEVAEQAARLVAPVVPLALERAVDLGGDREAHLAAEHDGVFGGQAVQPDDMAVEAPGDVKDASSTGPALPSPITASRFLIIHPALAARHAAVAGTVSAIIHQGPATGEHAR